MKLTEVNHKYANSSISWPVPVLCNPEHGLRTSLVCPPLHLHHHPDPQRAYHRLLPGQSGAYGLYSDLVLQLQPVAGCRARNTEAQVAMPPQSESLIQGPWPILLCCLPDRSTSTFQQYLPCQGALP